MIKLSNIHVSYGSKTVLEGVNIKFAEQGIVGIIGKNGSGKTSLLNVIAGVIEYTGSVKKEAEVGYLRQIDEYQISDFMNFDAHTKLFYQLLSELDVIDDIIFDQERIATLSGGEKTKLLLAQLLASEKHILILDEPTNHLDLKTKKWLISYLKRFQGLALIVSHDRVFLNETVDYIVEVENGKLTTFHGNYDCYQEMKTRQMNAEFEKYHLFKKSETKIKNEIEKYNNWSNKSEKQANKYGGMLSDAKIKGAKTRQQMRAMKLSKQAKAKVSRLEQHLEKGVKKPFESKAIKFGLQSSFSKTKELIYIDNMTKSYDTLIFKVSNLIITAQDKLVIEGVNGSGKSTFFKILLGLESYQGSITLAPHLKIAYLSQDVLDLVGVKTPLVIAKDLSREKQEMFLSNLINMNFPKQALNQQITKMSLGERMKIKLALIVIEDYNMIIFDEPTNHLDIETKLVFEKVINEYQGAMLIASHDRYITRNFHKKLIINNKELKCLAL